MSRPDFFAVRTSSATVPDFQALPIKTAEEKLKAIKEALKYLKELNKSPDFSDILLVFLDSDNVPSHSNYAEIKLNTVLLALANPRCGSNVLIALSTFLQNPSNTTLDQTAMNQILGLSDNVSAFAPRR